MKKFVAVVLVLLVMSGCAFGAVKRRNLKQKPAPKSIFNTERQVKRQAVPNVPDMFIVSNDEN